MASWVIRAKENAPNGVPFRIMSPYGDESLSVWMIGEIGMAVIEFCDPIAPVN